MKKTVVAALLLAELPAVASAMDKMAVQPDALKWGAAPASLPPGAQIAVLTGDPGKAGPYVVRVRLPAGYKIAPHTHPTAENVTVLSGTFHIAMGEKFDPKKGEAVRAGGFFTADKDMQHYGWTTRPAVIQIHGMGPFAINYVNPNDDPRTAKPTATKQEAGTQSISRSSPRKRGSGIKCPISPKLGPRVRRGRTGGDHTSCPHLF